MALQVPHIQIESRQWLNLVQRVIIYLNLQDFQNTNLFGSVTFNSRRKYMMVGLPDSDFLSYIFQIFRNLIF